MFVVARAIHTLKQPKWYPQLALPIQFLFDLVVFVRVCAWWLSRNSSNKEGFERKLSDSKEDQHESGYSRLKSSFSHPWTWREHSSHSLNEVCTSVFIQSAIFFDGWGAEAGAKTEKRRGNRYPYTISGKQGPYKWKTNGRRQSPSALNQWLVPQAQYGRKRPFPCCYVQRWLAFLRAEDGRWSWRTKGHKAKVWVRGCYQRRRRSEAGRVENPPWLCRDFKYGAASIRFSFLTISLSKANWSGINKKLTDVCSPLLKVLRF